MMFKMSNSNVIVSWIFSFNPIENIKKGIEMLWQKVTEKKAHYKHENERIISWLGSVYGSKE